MRSRWCLRVLAVVVMLSGISMAAPSAPAQTTGAVEGLVFDNSELADGIVVDLFRAHPNGERAEWLGFSTTGDAGPGRFRFEAPAGLYVLTYIAPEGRVFNESGQSWLDRRAVIEAGRTIETPRVAMPPLDTGTVVSGWVYRDFEPVPGVQVDHFTAAADGSRGTWIATSATDDFGRFTINVSFGCHVLTFVAPAGEVFSDTDAPWSNLPFCVAPGDPEILNLNADLTPRNSQQPTIVAVVEDERSRAGVPGVAIDLFSSDETGTRLEWLESAVTDADGRVTFVTRPIGCWVVTFIAPEGRSFTPFDELWRNQPFCLNGASPVDLLGRLNAAEVSVFLRPLLRQNGIILEHQPVDVYLATADGSRGAWLGGYDTHNGFEEGGGGRLPLIPTESCLVVTYRAPAGETFAETGTEWYNAPICVSGEPSQTVDVTAVLADRPSSTTVIDLRDGTVDFVLAVDSASSGANPAVEFVVEPGLLPQMTVLGAAGQPDCQPVEGLRLALFQEDIYLGFSYVEPCVPRVLVTGDGPIDTIRGFTYDTLLTGQYRVRAEAVRP